MNDPCWMIYGANGHSGELITCEAGRRGLKPVLAGRSAERIALLARELDWEHRAFALADAAVGGCRHRLPRHRHSQ